MHKAFLHSGFAVSVLSFSIAMAYAAADLNYIPVAAIDHVEVLQDGAAAQYGTDAIAGVVNIILKQNYKGGTATVNGGGYGDGGGHTGDGSVNLGLAPFTNSYLSLTA